jgi:hypothetical protein
MRTGLVSFLFAAAIVAVAIPAGAATDAPPKPAAEMSNLKIFDGSWTCEGKALPTPMGPGGSTTTTVEGHTALGGFWQSGTVKSTGAGMPTAMEGEFRMTYDPGAKQYVLLWVDNMGAFSQSRSPGWEGDKLVFTGEGTMSGNKMMVRDTFVKGADGSLRHDWEGQVEGKWTPFGTEKCTRGGAKP